MRGCGVWVAATGGNGSSARGGHREREKGRDSSTCRWGGAESAHRHGGRHGQARRGGGGTCASPRARLVTFRFVTLCTHSIHTPSSRRAAEVTEGRHEENKEIGKERKRERHWRREGRRGGAGELSDPRAVGGGGLRNTAATAPAWLAEEGDDRVWRGAFRHQRGDTQEEVALGGLGPAVIM